jgi:hypothetical protein
MLPFGEAWTGSLIHRRSDILDSARSMVSITSSGIVHGSGLWLAESSSRHCPKAEERQSQPGTECQRTIGCMAGSETSGNRHLGQPAKRRDHDYGGQHLPSQPCAGRCQQFGIPQSQPFFAAHSKEGRADCGKNQVACGGSDDAVGQKNRWCPLLHRQASLHQPGADKRNRQDIGNSPGSNIHHGNHDQCRQKGNARNQQPLPPQLWERP